MRALGAPLLQHEQGAGAQQHHHGGDQGDHGDTALEGDAPHGQARFLLVIRMDGGGRTEPFVVERGSDVGGHASP